MSRDNQTFIIIDHKPIIMLMTASGTLATDCSKVACRPKQDGQAIAKLAVKDARDMCKRIKLISITFIFNRSVIGRYINKR